MRVESRGGSGKKLAEEDIRAIRAIYEDGRMTCRDLGKMFDVSPVTISNVLQRKVYKWVK